MGQGAASGHLGGVAAGGGVGQVGQGALVGQVGQLGQGALVGQGTCVAVGVCWQAASSTPNANNKPAIIMIFLAP